VNEKHYGFFIARALLLKDAVETFIAKLAEGIGGYGRRLIDTGDDAA